MAVDGTDVTSMLTTFGGDYRGGRITVAAGQHTITCSNGQKMNVSVEAKGGGLTVGKSSLSGKGEFSGVKNINDILGSYATAEASAGASKSSGAQAMTKGEVSLAIAGTGEGWDIGFSFGKFTITKR